MSGCILHFLGRFCLCAKPYFAKPDVTITFNIFDWHRFHCRRYCWYSLVSFVLTKKFIRRATSFACLFISWNNKICLESHECRVRVEWYLFLVYYFLVNLVKVISSFRVLCETSVNVFTGIVLASGSKIRPAFPRTRFLNWSTRTVVVGNSCRCVFTRVGIVSFTSWH